MTPSELKAKLATTESKFFSRDNMKFSGDTMRNYGVTSTVINTYTEDNVEVWELYRKKPVKHGLSNSAYFRKDNYSQTFRKE